MRKRIERPYWNPAGVPPVKPYTMPEANSKEKAVHMCKETKHINMLPRYNIPENRCKQLLHIRQRRRRPCSWHGRHNYLSKCNGDPCESRRARSVPMTIKTCMNDDKDCTYHSQNAYLANTTMVCTRRFKMRTLLAISQVSSLKNIPKKSESEKDDRN